VERLKEDLWEGDLPASAASTLKSHVSLLRRSLGPDRLSYGDGAYVLKVGPDELDVTLFEKDAAAGLDLLRAGDARDAADILRQGLDRWRGRALADAADTPWGAPESVRLEELRDGSTPASRSGKAVRSSLRLRPRSPSTLFVRAYGRSSSPPSTTAAGRLKPCGRISA
jgi:hypothetical protein